MQHRQMHHIIALDTLSYDDEKGLCNGATTRMSAEEIRRGEHLATVAIRNRFKATVKRFRHTFTPEFVESTLGPDIGANVEIVSDIRSPPDIRGRNHRISFVVFAYLDASDAINDSEDESSDLVYFSSSTLKLLTQRAKSMNDTSSVFVAVLIPGEHRAASLERFKQLQYEANGQMADFPGIDSATLILPVFVDARQHVAVETRRKLAFALTHHSDFFVEDTSAYQSLLALRKMVEIGVSDYVVDSRKRTVDDEPVLSIWSTFLAANREQVDDDKKADLLALVRDFIVVGDVTAPLPIADALVDEDTDDAQGNDEGNGQHREYDIDEDLFFNR